MKINDKILAARKTLSAAVVMLLAVAGCMLSTGCELDNMDAPDCHVYGKVGYRDASGQFIPIGVKGSGSGNLARQVIMEIWQAGFGKEAAQEMNVGQDGSFSSYVYAGKIRLIPKNGTGPWSSADTVRLDVKGSTYVEFEVKPYFVVNDAQYSFNPTDSVLAVSFSWAKTDPNATLASMGVLLNERQFVDLSYNNYTHPLNGVPEGKVTVNVPLKGVAAVQGRRSMYARVFVKSKESTEAVYSTTPYKLW